MAIVASAVGRKTFVYSMNKGFTSHWPAVGHDGQKGKRFSI